MEIKANKPGITRTVSENRNLSEALKAGEPQGPRTASDTKQLDLREGQQVRGHILDLRYNEVRIQIEPGKQVVTAKLSGEVPLSIGEEARFQVTEDSARRLVLKYIPDEAAAAEAAVQKALAASGLPGTERNKAIVRELLKHRMPVDKQTLQELIKLSVNNREASPLTLVLMYKNNIPMTAANIRQFEACQNGTNRLLSSITRIIKNLSGLLERPDAAADSPPVSIRNAVLRVNDKLLGILSANSDPASANIRSEASDITANIPADGPGNIPAHILVGIPSTIPAGIPENISADITAEAAKQTAGPADIPSSGIVQAGAASSPAAYELSKPYLQPDENTALLSSVLNSGEQAAFTGLLSSLQTTDTPNYKIIDGSASLQEVFAFIREKLSQAEEAAAQSLLQSPEYIKLLEEAFRRKWTITPAQLAKKEAVPKWYQRLQEDMEKLSSLEKDDIKALESLRLQEPVKDVQESLRFMRDLNEIFTYLQLPVQLRDQNIHSELYVYTNKKAPRNKKSLSVLLHLEMPGLGPLNIRIRMDHNLVHAQFCLETSDTEKLIEDNLPSLAQALKKKGYSFTAEVLDTYRKPDFSRDFIETGFEEDGFTRYTFDIRA